MGGWKISGRIENWDDRKVLVFPHVCLVGGVENFFVWLERKVRG